MVINDSLEGKIAFFTPVAAFVPTVWTEPFRVFSFGDEIVGLIIEVRSYINSGQKNGSLSVHELDVLIGDKIYCHTYNSSRSAEFRILEDKC